MVNKRRPFCCCHSFFVSHDVRPLVKSTEHLSHTSTCRQSNTTVNSLTTATTLIQLLSKWADLHKDNNLGHLDFNNLSSQRLHWARPVRLFGYRNPSHWITVHRQFLREQQESLRPTSVSSWSEQLRLVDGWRLADSIRRRLKLTLTTFSLRPSTLRLTVQSLCLCWTLVSRNCRM